MPSRHTNYLPLYVLRLLSTGTHSCTIAMSRLRHALLSALRSLLHRTQHIHSLFAAFLHRLRSPKRPIGPTSPALAYAAEIEQLFGTIFEHDALLELASGLRKQYREALKHNPACMLPSYNHVLPTGEEEGVYVALDVGGSTFRVAVVELYGRGRGGCGGSEFKALKTYEIDDSVKQLAGEKFFEWLAERIEETLKGVQGLKILETERNDRVNVGLSWSFPIEHTSLRSGRIQAMGKGFRAMEGLLGADLADVLQGACDRRVSILPSALKMRHIC
jgi:hexokinase